MSRLLEQQREEKQRKADVALVAAIEFNLAAAVGHSGGELLGFSAKLNHADCLLILRAQFPGGLQVAFVGSSSLADALRKGVRLGLADELNWRADRYANK